MAEAYVSVGQAASMLKMSADRVRQLLREGELVGRKTSGKWWIERQALEHWKTLHRLEK